VGAAALVLIIAASAVWLYFARRQATQTQRLAINGTTQPITTADDSGHSGMNDKPVGATQTTQQDLPADSSQSAQSEHALLNSLPKPSDYVNDFAHVLSPAAVANLDRICIQLDHSKADAQVAVVTIDTLNGADIADFTKQLFNNWGIGHKGSNRGVAVLLAVKDRKYRITVGYGLESILTDTKAAEIGRTAAPLLHANDFDQGVISIVTQVAQVVTDDANAGLNPSAGQAPSPTKP
jgi:uncharacterized membrane protein YgcG